MGFLCIVFKRLVGRPLKTMSNQHGSIFGLERIDMKRRGKALWTVALGAAIGAGLMSVIMSPSSDSARPTTKPAAASTSNLTASGSQLSPSSSATTRPNASVCPTSSVPATTTGPAPELSVQLGSAGYTLVMTDDTWWTWKNTCDPQAPIIKIKRLKPLIDRLSNTEGSSIGTFWCSESLSATRSIPRMVTDYKAAYEATKGGSLIPDTRQMPRVPDEDPNVQFYAAWVKVPSGIMACYSGRAPA